MHTRSCVLLAAVVVYGVPRVVAGQASANKGAAQKDSTKVSIFADGNIQGVATGASHQSTVATGSLGIALTKGRFSWSALVAVASTVDTLKGQVGTILLNPAAG